MTIEIRHRRMTIELESHGAWGRTPSVMNLQISDTASFAIFSTFVGCFRCVASYQRARLPEIFRRGYERNEKYRIDIAIV